MPDVSAIAAALNSLNSAGDIAQAMIGLRDQWEFRIELAKFQRQIIEANNRVIAAQEERESLLQKIFDLQKKVADLKAERSEKERYNLKIMADKHSPMS